MKTVLCILLFILSFSKLRAQQIMGSHNKEWIRKKGYVQLTDSANLPQIVKPYLKIITEKVSDHRPSLKNFYFFIRDIHIDSNTVSLMLFPVDGIMEIKNYDDKEKGENREEQLKELKDSSKNKMRLQIIDSFGGSVGEILVKLIKATNEIKFYSFQ